MFLHSLLLIAHLLSSIDSAVLLQEKINAVFDNLTQLVHTNLVKFHKYWTDAKSEKPRVRSAQAHVFALRPSIPVNISFQIIFITEYMSSGSMSLFLQRTRKSGSPLSIKVSFRTEHFLEVSWFSSLLSLTSFGTH